MPCVRARRSRMSKHRHSVTSTHTIDNYWTSRRGHGVKAWICVHHLDTEGDFQNYMVCTYSACLDWGVSQLSMNLLFVTQCTVTTVGMLSVIRNQLAVYPPHSPSNA